MRTPLVLFVGVLLCAAGCTRKADHAPPPLDKQLLVGKWKNRAEGQFISDYEFAEGGRFKMKVKGMDQDVPAAFSWSGDRSVMLEFKETPASVKEAYKKAAKAYKDDVQKRVKEKKLTDRAAPGMLKAVLDELPDQLQYQSVGISEKPRMLILTRENGMVQNFDKVE